MDRIPERLRTAAEGVAKATQMMADAKSKRNGDGACYSGLKPEQTAEWKAAEMIERLQQDGEAFRVAVIESGALNSVSQDKYINQLRAFESALALNR